MPTARQGHEAGQIGGKIYVVGGVLGGAAGSSLNENDSYDPVLDTWSTSPADMPTPRGRFSHGVLQNQLLVAGGSSNYFNFNAPFYDDFETYDPGDDTWSTGPSMPVGLRAAASAVSGNTFYVFGGNGSSGQSSAVYAISVVPEPTCLGLVLTGLCFGLRRRR